MSKSLMSSPEVEAEAPYSVFPVKEEAAVGAIRSPTSASSYGAIAWV
jgi:hypothetical protein